MTNHIQERPMTAVEIFNEVSMDDWSPEDARAAVAIWLGTQPWTGPKGDRENDDWSAEEVLDYFRCNDLTDCLHTILRHCSPLPATKWLALLQEVEQTKYTVDDSVLQDVARRVMEMTA